MVRDVNGINHRVKITLVDKSINNLRRKGQWKRWNLPGGPLQAHGMLAMRLKHLFPQVRVLSTRMWTVNCVDMGLSIHGGTSKWMVYFMEKSPSKIWRIFFEKFRGSLRFQVSPPVLIQESSGSHGMIQRFQHETWGPMAWHRGPGRTSFGWEHHSRDSRGQREQLINDTTFTHKYSAHKKITYIDVKLI